MKKKGTDTGIVLDKGPFKGKRIVYAETGGIDHYEDLAYDLISRVFAIKAYLVSDESSLWNFCDFGRANKAEQEAVWQKIHELYGVDVSDIKNGNLLAICQRISRLSLQTALPKDSH